jgi:branched-subunit amino acid transport protein
MEGTLKLWVVILAVGALNYASRLSFIAFFARRTMPPLLARALRYVPAAMLAALIVPMIAMPAAVAPFNPKIPAAVIAGAVAWFTKSSLKTMVAGMAALWILQAVLLRIG